MVGLATGVEGETTTGRLDATLTTTGENVLDGGSEVRLGKLVFSFGAGIDQVVVDGSSIYPAAGSTIAVNSSTIRPITGGSGAYAGARGWCDSTHLADGTWKHALHLLPWSTGGRTGFHQPGDRLWGRHRTCGPR